jgi:hypothetical protein
MTTLLAPPHGKEPPNRAGIALIVVTEEEEEGEEGEEEEACLSASGRSVVESSLTATIVSSDGSDDNRVSERNTLAFTTAISADLKLHRFESPPFDNVVAAALLHVKTARSTFGTIVLATTSSPPTPTPLRPTPLAPSEFSVISSLADKGKASPLFTDDEDDIVDDRTNA